MRSIQIFSFWVVFLVLFKISTSIVYDLCGQDVKVYCVGLTDTPNCDNCDGHTIQEIVNMIDTSGNFTIYLVGSSSETVMFNESVKLNKTTPINIESTNNILPYPGHSIIWGNIGNYKTVGITERWWRISGDGGYLKLINGQATTDSNSVVGVDVGGVFLDNFDVENFHAGFNIRLMYISSCDGVFLLGVEIGNIRFSGLKTGHVIFYSCSCTPGNCLDTSFTDLYGHDKRIWIHDCVFNTSEPFSYISGVPLVYTIERNYFVVGGDIQQILQSEEDDDSDGYLIKNNVFHVLSVGEVDKVLDNRYRASGVHHSGGKNRMFNNLIIDESATIGSLFFSYRKQFVDLNRLPDPTFFYNNLIVSSACIPMVECYDSSGVVAASNIHFQYNRHINPEEAIKVAIRSKVKKSFSMHHSTFILTDEPVLQPRQILKECLEKRNLKDEFFETLDIGETRILKLPLPQLQKEEEKEEKEEVEGEDEDDNEKEEKNYLGENYD